MTVITRFAPSPSGALHIGGARTALFNYLYSKSKGGKFKLRIENTDQKRDFSSSTSSIINSLKWLGIDYDEEIVFQNSNIKKHLQIINKLVKEKLAYKCFLKKPEIDELRQKKRDTGQKIESIWREKNENEHPKNSSYVVRMKIPYDNLIKIYDEIQGEIIVKSKEIDDFIILRSDKTPTFLISSAADDVEMKISHIIRGDDHLTNTFRQYYIYKFLSSSIPKFAHIPLIHNKDGKKLSKRDNVQSIDDLKSQGFLKEAILNYLMRLGWSFKNKEIISLDQARNSFDFRDLGKSAAKIDEKKINYLNSYYMKNLPLKKIYGLLIEKIENNNIKIKEDHKSKIFKVLKPIIDRSNNIKDLYNSVAFIYDNSILIDNINYKKILRKSLGYKEDIIEKLKTIEKWEKDVINTVLKAFIEKNNISFKEIGEPLRILLTKSLNSPSILLIMETLGKKEVIKRLNEIW